MISTRQEMKMIDKDFAKADDISMNQFWCELVEHMFAEDINEGFLTATVHEGKTNEFTLKVRLTLTELDGKIIEELDEEDEEVA